MMTIKSNPPGAVVYLNDQELGRTPLERDFTWYGNYQVEIRREGYETLKTHKWVKAPFWNWVPFDLIANIVPWQVRDHQTLTFALKPINEAETAPGPLMERAMQMQGQLQSSPNTRMPSTQPTTKPSRRTGATTKPTE
jgi:hypothetical protein